MDAEEQSRSWWIRPELRADPAAYRELVSSAERRDGAARRRRISPAEGDVDARSREFFAGFAPLSVYTEDVGGFAAEALLSVGLPADLRARLVRAMWDEIRHSDLFFELCDTLDVDISRVDTSPVGALLEVLDGPAGPLEFAVMHTELEALALDFFQLAVAAQDGTPVGDVYRTVSADEATHVNLGMEIISHMASRGERIEADVLARTLDCAVSLSPLGHPGSLSPLAESLSLPVGVLVERLTTRRNRRGARMRALLFES